MVKLKDISIYFKSNCCNKITTNDGMVSTLGETIPGKWHSEKRTIMETLSHLPLHEVCVTFTPKQRENNSLVLHTKFKSVVEGFMKKHRSKRPVWIFYPEYSPKGYLHYHAIIYFDNACHYYVNEIKRILRNRFGNTEGKEVYNFSVYYDYMTKDKEKDLGHIYPFYGNYLEDECIK